jgi:transposase InsO family protein
MIAFIDAYRGQFGVELICQVMRAAIPGFLTARGYRADRTRPPSDREIRDEQLIADLVAVHRKNYSVYGVKKMHQAMKRKGWNVGREQTHRLMKKTGLRGARRGKPVFTTITDPAAAQPADLVNRQFKASMPHRLWVADITFVRTWQGFCYTAFVTKRMHQRKSSAGRSRRQCAPRTSRCKHSITQCGSRTRHYLSWSIIPTVDRSQYLSLAYTDRLAELGIAPSVASRGESYDNALAEAVNAAYKTELINRGKPWRCIDDVELSTAEWLARYNQERLHDALGYQTPAEYEAALTGTSHPASQPTPALATD